MKILNKRKVCHPERSGAESKDLGAKITTHVNEMRLRRYDRESFGDLELLVRVPGDNLDFFSVRLNSSFRDSARCR